MIPKIDILWPLRTPPEIREVQFSYEFCGRVTRKSCEAAVSFGSWVEHGPEETLGKVLSRTGSDLALLVLEPELILCAEVLDRMLRTTGGGLNDCGPVYNRSGFPAQQAMQAMPYLNVTSYLETARRIARNEPVTSTPVNALDPGCILYRRPFLRRLPQETPLEDVPDAVHGEGEPGAAVDRGALVHRFESYYDAARDDLVGLVPEGVERVLDIGCARGGYGRRLKELRPNVYLTGIEESPVMAAAARAWYDLVLGCPVEDAHLHPGFDLINCGDILEHLDDPWGMLAVFAGLLKQGGSLILSVPNIGHWTVVRDLLSGRFQYLPVGLTCITHIRWFTEAEICQALERCGFRMDVLEREQVPATPEGEAFIQQQIQAGWGDETSLRTNEIVIRAVKTPAMDERSGATRL